MLQIYVGLHKNETGYHTFPTAIGGIINISDLVALVNVYIQLIELIL
jgi:hypothetical protein